MTGNHPTKRIESQIWLKVISQQTSRNDVLKISICLATSIWGNSNLSKYGDFSPFFPQTMATFAHFFQKKKPFLLFALGVIFSSP
jgi:hypothetical protein